MATGFSVFVNIGAKVASSVGSSISQVEKQFSGLSNKLKMRSLETKLALKDMQATSHAFGAALAGIGIGHGIKAVIGDGAEYQNEIFALKNAGRTVTEVAEGIRKAHEVVGSLPTSTFSENLKLLNETTGAFGNYDHALENLGFNAKLGSMMKSSFGDKMGDEGSAFNDLVRAFEMRGTASNPATYQKEVGELYKAMVFTRGNVNPHEFLNFAQQANPAIKNLSEHFLTRIAPSLIQEFGGDKAGTQLSAFRSVIMGKANDKKQAEAWMKSGLLDPKQAFMKNGTPIAWKAGAVKGTDLALSDPLAWAEQYGLKGLEKLGVDVNNQMAVSKALGTMFRNQNSNRFAEAIFQARDRARLHKDEGLINQVPGFDKQYNSSLGQITTAVDAVHSAFKDLFASLSAPLLEPAARALSTLASGIQKVAAVLAEHPMLGGGLGLAGGVLSGVAGLKAFKATLDLLGLAGVGPFKLIKAELYSIGAAASGVAAAGIRKIGAAALALGRPTRALKALGKAADLSVGSALGLAALVTAGTFISNNWKGLGKYVDSFADAIKKAGAPQTIAAFQPLIDAGRSARDVFGQLTGTIDDNKWQSWGAANGAQAKQWAEDLAAAGAAIRTLSDAWNSFSQYSSTGPGDMLANTRREFESLKATWTFLTTPLDFSQSLNNVRQFATDAAGAITGFNWASVGLQIVDGILSGVSSMGAAVGDKIRGMFNIGGGPKSGSTPNPYNGFKTTGIGGLPVEGTRALGGSVGGGLPYLVGERGPEIFVPGGSGRIETHAAMQRLMSARGGGAAAPTVNHGPITVNVTVHASSSDPRGISQEVAKALRFEMRRMQQQQRGLLSD